MDVKISKNVTVADQGAARQFLKGKSYPDVHPDTVRRLKRAGAILDPSDYPVTKAKAAKRAEPKAGGKSDDKG